jgi:thioredoxin-like negative regulator of GroEL
MFSRARLVVLCAAFCVLQSAIRNPQSAIAQEVQWRHDYAAARKEAVEKDRPLVIDFGTENCFWCKQLDLRTFRDAAVVRSLNEQFVPLKIDAQREPDLTSRLRIQTFPTIVIASPEGKILDAVEGFKEAGPFQDHLKRALAGVTPPAQVVLDCQEAARAIQASDYRRAIGLLKQVMEDRKEHPVKAKAGQMLRELEQQAASRLATGRQQADRGEVAEASATLRELVRTFAGTPAAVEGSQLLAALDTLAVRTEAATSPGPRAQRARELLAQAREEFRTRQYLCCLERCEQVVAQFGDLPEGSQAQQLAGEIKSNPEWMKQACDTLSERLSLLYLSLADTWIKNGQPHQAVIYLERVVQAFPGTRHAEAAQIRLLQMQGQTTRPVNYKNP